MDSLWPYLQVKQPYLDCVTTIRVRLQEPFSALGEAVKRMIDHAEDFTRTGRNIWNAGHRRCTSTDTRQAAVSVPLPLPRRAWAYRKESLRGRQGLEPRQVASVIEFKLLPIRKVGLSVSRKVRPLLSPRGGLIRYHVPWLILNTSVDCVT